MLNHDRIYFFPSFFKIILITICLFFNCNIKDEEDLKEIKIIETNPSSLSDDNPVNPIVYFQFNTYLDPRIINNNAISITSNAIKPYGEVRYSAVDKKLSYVLQGNLRKGLGYKITLYKDYIRGIGGETLTQDYEFTFFTGEDEQNHPVSEIITYEQDIAPILNNKCAGCHSSTTNYFDISTPDGIRESLIDIPSSGWIGWQRIESWKPAFSYIIYKILGVFGIEGAQMPINNPLNYDEMKLIEQWIEMGCPLN